MPQKQAPKTNDAAMPLDVSTMHTVNVENPILSDQGLTVDYNIAVLGLSHGAVLNEGHVWGTRDVILQQDTVCLNAAPRKFVNIDVVGWELLVHLPFCLNLAPWNYFSH